MEFGASIVSKPSAIVTFGATGALFIRVAGIGGMACAGTGWAGATAFTWLLSSFADAFFAVNAFFFVNACVFLVDVCVFRGAGACAPEFCARAPPEIMASTHAIAITRLIAGSALPGSSWA